MNQKNGKNSLGLDCIFEYIDNPLGNTGHTACPIWMLKNLV